MFLKLSETFKFFTRLGGKFFGLKSIRLGQFNSERPSSGSGSCRTTLKICTLSKSLCWENWICVCIFPINMFCIMQLPPKRVLGQESAIFCDIQISVHWVYLEASRGQLYSRGSDLLRWGQLYSGGSDWHLSFPSRRLYFHHATSYISLLCRPIQTLDFFGGEKRPILETTTFFGPLGLHICS